MTDAMRHRGPDDEGFYTSGSLGLGFRRLSIIDLAGGHQPMSDASETIWVVFNGEIYNFHELKEELQGRGHIFRTRSDTEVIVHGYKEWGSEVLQRLNGMFGLAIWNNERRELLLARDPMGIKPLYYRVSGRKLLFASEIRPLFSEHREKPEIDPSAASLFLRYRYTPSPLTVFKGVKKLAPGTKLTVRENTEPHVERWYKFKPEPFDPMPNDAEAEEQLLGLYRRAIKRQLISDVPLGLLLSGGLDSGLLLALMNEDGVARNTYTVGYGSGFDQDELGTAAETAALLHAPNVSVEISRQEFETCLPEILKSVEEPVAASSVVPMYHVCRRARQDVKVAFVGQGPDELFGGYIRHLGVRYGEYWRAMPNWLKAPLSLAVDRYSGNESLRRGIYSLNATDRLERYQKVFSVIGSEGVRELFQPDALGREDNDQVPELWRDLEPLMASTDELGGLQFLEIRSSLPDELLMYGDKMSMANSLEVRVPFLDKEIVEYVERLSAYFKVRYGRTKWLHRRICQRLLPKTILQRKKVGFAVNVVDDWFRKSLATTMDSVLLDSCSRIYNYLNFTSVSRLVNEHKNGHRDNHKILFSLVVFEHFARNVV